MVTKQKYYSRDPNGLGRGPGMYYLRGGKRSGSFTLPSGKTIDGPYYSKYCEDRDAARFSSGSRKCPIGQPKELRKFAHVGDGNLARKRRR